MTAIQELWAWIDANIHEESFNLNDAREISIQREKEQTEAAYHDGVDDARNNSIKYGYYKDKKKNIHIERSPEWP
jgi:hypothetical protein